MPAKFQECGLYFASSLCSLKLPKRRLFRFFHASAEICLFSLPKTQLFSSPHVCCGFFSGAGYISRVHLGAKFPKRRLFRFFSRGCGKMAVLIAENTFSVPRAARDRIITAENTCRKHSFSGHLPANLVHCKSPQCKHTGSYGPAPIFANRPVSKRRA